MEEIWKDISGYETYYQVSDCGRVRRLRTKNGVSKVTIRRLRKEWTGYVSCCLSVNHCEKVFKVHRLVAMAFIDNIENKPFVNHKDGNKSNNVMSNLEWVTKSENEKHAYGFLGKNSGAKNRINELNGASKPIIATRRDGISISFPSSREAERKLGIGFRAISNNLKGKAKSAGGYIFKYQ